MMHRGAAAIACPWAKFGTYLCIIRSTFNVQLSVCLIIVINMLSSNSVYIAL